MRKLKSILAPYSRLMFICGLFLLTLCACTAMTGCMVPGWLSEVEKIGELVGTMVGSILTIAGKLTADPALTAVGAALELGVEAAQAASTGLTAAIKAYKSTPNETTLASVVAAIQATQASLKQIEKIEGVPAADQAVISEIVSILTQELEAAESILPLATDGAAGTTLGAVKVPNTPDTTKAKVAASLAKLPTA